MKRVILIHLLLSIGALSGYSQGERLAVWESGIFVSYQSFKSWKLNTSIVQRTTSFSEDENENLQFSYLEINQIINRKINPWINVALGYKYRSNYPVDELTFFEHRITQQLGWTHFEQRARLVSRFRVEQRISNEDFAQRHRYRLSLDLPLSGEKLDPKEFYLSVSNEILWQVGQNESEWSDRIGASIGYVLSKSARLELSFIHRMEDFTNTTDHTPFLHTNLLISL